MFIRSFITVIVSATASALAAPNSAQAESLRYNDGKICVSDENRDCFSSTLTLGVYELKLVGARNFNWLFFDVYSAALYGTATVAARREFTGQDPITLEIRYHRKFDRQELIEAADKILSTQGAPVPALRDRLDLLNSAYKSVSEGDSYILNYLPDSGGSTELLFNGERLVTIPGKDFAIHYFAIWLAKKDAVDQKLRDALFNTKCDKAFFECL